jgi:hypothetical protein
LGHDSARGTETTGSAGELDGTFTRQVPVDGSWWPPEKIHLAPLDDFGPEAPLDVLSSFSPQKASRDRHRRFVWSVVPLGLENAGPGFTEYRGGD